MDKFCIITGEKLTASNNSKAHVIPSALGWRFKPYGIVSKNGNTEVGEKIDQAIITSFQSFASMLNVSRDRGTNQPITLQDEKGRSYVVAFGEPLKLKRPDYQCTTNSDGGKSIRIEARTMKELRQLLGRAVNEVPSLNIDEAMAHALQTQEWPDGMLHGQVEIGPASVWPSLFVGASIFAVSKECDVHPELAEYVKRFDPENIELPPDTFYFVPEQTWVNKGDAISHLVVLVTDTARRKALVYMEVFNTAGVAVTLPYTGSKDITAVEFVNVIAGKRSSVDVDAPLARSLDWSATHAFGDPALMALQQQAISRLVREGQSRSFEAALEEVSRSIMGDGDGVSITTRELVSAVENLANHTILMSRRSGLTVEDLDFNLRGFIKVCEDFQNMVPLSRRCLFAAAIAPTKRRVRHAIEKIRMTLS